MKNYKPSKFIKSNPYSIFNINNYCRINNINSICLSNEYVNCYSKLKFKCDCGNIFEVSWNSFKKKQQKCKTCSGGINKEKNSLDFFKNEFNKKGYKILSNLNNFNNKSKFCLKDKDNYKYHSSYHDLKYGLDKFSKFNPFTIYNINNYIAINNLGIKLLSTQKDYVDAYSNLTFSCCECGKEYKCSFGQIRHGRTRCQKCNKQISSLEFKTEKFLKENNIIYKKQVKFKKCLYKRELPFDFGIYDENNNLILLIECDGRQHFEEINHFKSKDLSPKEALKERKLKDNIKNKFCNDNNIKLIRIPYWNFNNDEYIKILKKEIINIS